jgi:signal peptidase II
MRETRPTRRRTGEIVTLLGVAGVVLVADQVTKAAVAASLALGDHADVLGTVVQIWHAENSGAAFSLFQGGLPLFLFVSVVALGLVAYFAWSLRDRSVWVFVLLGLLLGGTLGNLVDRLARGGRVIDFLSVGIGDLRWPTFNVADSSLDIGIVGLVAFLWWFDRREARSRSAADGGSLPAPGVGPGDIPRGGGAG